MNAIIENKDGVRYSVIRKEGNQVVLKSLVSDEEIRIPATKTFLAAIGFSVKKETK